MKTVMFQSKMMSEDLDGVVFDGYLRGMDYDHHPAYCLKCGHSDVGDHPIKVYNDYCPFFRSKTGVI